MTCTQAVLSLMLISPCSDGGGPNIDLAIAESLANPARLETDRLRDPLSRPDLVLAFFEIAPGMTVLDLFSGGGYYTEIISNVVGPDGSVIAQNNEAYLAFAAKDLEPRFADDHLGNVTRLTVEANDLNLPPASLDAVMASLTWHDFYNADPEEGWPAIDEPTLTAKLCAAVKPGGVLGVIDHVAVAGSDPHETAVKLHRIDPERIKADLADSCFKFEGEISVLRNPADDLGIPMNDPSVRGKTDRVVYKFRRK
jgi:predicted methyltransferase